MKYFSCTQVLNRAKRSACALPTAISVFSVKISFADQGPLRGSENGGAFGAAKEISQNTVGRLRRLCPTDSVAGRALILLLQPCARCMKTCQRGVKALNVKPMNKHFPIFISLIIGLTVLTARAQSRPPTGPNIDGAMEKLFGDNNNFSATMEFQVPTPKGEMNMSAKMAHTAGKTRIEMDMTAMQGANMPPQAMAQMKKMGMAHMVVLNNTGGASYMIYPDMRAYVPMPGASQPTTPPSDYKVDVTKIGDDTIDGHSCVKNKCVVTGSSGPAHESTVWNATDLKNFPLKIETKSDEGQSVVMVFKDVKLDKPDDSQFDPPSGFQKYDDMMSLMMAKARPQP
jgi:outer membrane lipoprotein-sorting protein